MSVRYGTCAWCGRTVDLRAAAVTARVGQLAPGDEVLVDAFGYWRPGLVVKILRTRIRVTYDLPSGARTRDFPVHSVRLR